MIDVSICNLIARPAVVVDKPRHERVLSEVARVELARHCGRVFEAHAVVVENIAQRLVAQNEEGAIDAEQVCAVQNGNDVRDSLLGDESQSAVDGAHHDGLMIL